MFYDFANNWLLYAIHVRSSLEETSLNDLLSYFGKDDPSNPNGNRLAIDSITMILF